MGGDAEWWRDAAVLQIYPRSFADADGDGVGDLDGVTARLPYVAALGVDAVWLTPFQRSPQADHGYDVSDYCDVDPLFGDLGALDRLLGRAHDLGLRVIVDLVPNHCSSAHPLFAAALAAGPGSSERAPLPLRAGPRTRRGGAAEQLAERLRRPGVDAGAATAEWYLHLYAPEQPDWNWRDPRTAAFFDDVLRFWFDRGVDGVRIDVAHGLFKAPGLPDLSPADLAAADAGAPAGGPARVRPGGGARRSTGAGGRWPTRTTRRARSSARSTWTRTGRPATPARTSCTRPSRSASSPRPGTPRPGATSARNCWRHGCRAAAR